MRENQDLRREVEKLQAEGETYLQGERVSRFATTAVFTVTMYLGAAIEKLQDMVNEASTAEDEMARVRGVFHVHGALRR